MDVSPLKILAITDQGAYILMGLSAVFLLYIAAKPFFTRKRRDPLVEAPTRMGLSQQKSLDREMQNLLVELHEMARKMSAQIDTRAAKLEVLIQQADQRMEMLRQLNQIASGDSDMTQSTTRPPMRLVRAEETVAEVAENISRSLANEIQAGRSGSNASDRSASYSNVETPDDRYRAIYDLADSGMTAQVIAQRLSRPTGEIELILALRPRSVSQEAPAIEQAV